MTATNIGPVLAFPRAQLALPVPSASACPWSRVLPAPLSGSDSMELMAWCPLTHRHRARSPVSAARPEVWLQFPLHEHTVQTAQHGGLGPRLALLP